MILAETKETLTRKAFPRASLSELYYSSEISASKGGIAIIIKDSFKKNFRTIDWIVKVKGRAG